MEALGIQNPPLFTGMRVRVPPPAPGYFLLLQPGWAASDIFVPLSASVIRPRPTKSPEAWAMQEM